MFMSSHENSGDRLRQRAKELRYRPVDIAKELGELPQTVNAWLTRGVPYAKLDAVAELLDCNVQWLRDGIGTASVSGTQEKRGAYELDTEFGRKWATLTEKEKAMALAIIEGIASVNDD